MKFFYGLAISLVIALAIVILCAHTCKGDTTGVGAIKAQYRAIAKEIKKLEKDEAALRRMIEKKCPLRFEPIQRADSVDVKGKK